MFNGYRLLYDVAGVAWRCCVNITLLTFHATTAHSEEELGTSSFHSETAICTVQNVFLKKLLNMDME